MLRDIFFGFSFITKCHNIFIILIIIVDPCILIFILFWPMIHLNYCKNVVTFFFGYPLNNLYNKWGEPIAYLIWAEENKYICIVSTLLSLPLWLESLTFIKKFYIKNFEISTMKFWNNYIVHIHDINYIIN